jgi:hypothetical protein
MLMAEEVDYVIPDGFSEFFGQTYDNDLSPDIKEELLSWTKDFPNLGVEARALDKKSKRHELVGGGNYV